jgi:hypothetical protein
MKKIAVLSRLLALCLAAVSFHAAAAPTACQQSAVPACYQSLQLPQGGGALHFYASLPEGATPRNAIVAMHGHPRDASRTFDATLLAAKNVGALDDTLVIAPVFQVAASRSAKCNAPGTPDPQDGDALWTCSSWLDGERSTNGARPTSFAALDALIGELVRRWPSLQGITLAGFSAGAQMVQHYIGFAQPDTDHAPALRYVVSDPGTWLYFDAYRPEPAGAGCPGVNRWKYGTEGLPAELGRSAAEARARYAAAEIHYLEAELDGADHPGTAYRVLDKSCGAMAQGPFRLQRGQGYAEYDRKILAPEKNRQVTVVPGCAHSVACVFPSDAARTALFGTGR